MENAKTIFHDHGRGPLPKGVPNAAVPAESAPPIVAPEPQVSVSTEPAESRPPAAPQFPTKK